jgi:endonuclease III
LHCLVSVVQIVRNNKAALVVFKVTYNCDLIHHCRVCIALQHLDTLSKLNCVSKNFCPLFSGMSARSSSSLRSLFGAIQGTMIAEDEAGWQIPVGLTAAEAICIESDSDCDAGDQDCSSNNASKSESPSPLPPALAANTDTFDAQNDCDVINATIREQRKDIEASNENDESACIRENSKSSHPERYNPYECFAYDPKSAAVSMPNRPNHTVLRTSKPSSQTTYSLTKKPRLSCDVSKTNRHTRKSECDPPEEITEECITKWHSFAISTDPIELQRFHLLISARLHARCQEGTVHKAMSRLRQHFKSSDGLNPINLSESNPEDIAPLLSSVLFGNTKAKQLVQAAQDVVKMGGEVPETSLELQKITGIGPKLAHILSRVNTRASYLS